MKIFHEENGMRCGVNDEGEVFLKYTRGYSTILYALEDTEENRDLILCDYARLSGKSFSEEEVEEMIRMAYNIGYEFGTSLFADPYRAEKMQAIKEEELFVILKQWSKDKNLHPLLASLL